MHDNSHDGGTDGLASSAQRKQVAVTALKGLETDLKADGGRADGSTHDAINEFKGWDTGQGLQDALTEWGNQVTALHNRFLSEQSALSTTNNLFQNNYSGAAGMFNSHPSGPSSPRHDAPPDPESRIHIEAVAVLGGNRAYFSRDHGHRPVQAHRCRRQVGRDARKVRGPEAWPRIAPPSWHCGTMP